MFDKSTCWKILCSMVAGALLVGCSDGIEQPLEEVDTSTQPLTLQDRITACSTDPRVVAGVISLDICVGGDLFFRETFNGNGRSCSTCHRVDRSMTIDPTFMQTLPATDPLFTAEFNPTLANLERPPLMHQFGLILENIDGFAPDPTTHFVMRGIPHVLSLSQSIRRDPTDTVNPPQDRTGWSGDGAPNAGTLRDFMTGAIRQHYTKSLARTEGTDFRQATSDELDRINTFLLSVGRNNDLILTQMTLSDPGADAGRTTFINQPCDFCHNEATAKTPNGGGNLNFNTGIETSKNAALAGLPIDGGFGRTPNPDGSFGDGTFNPPPLIEAADTAPFFHTAVTVSGASAHNTAFASTIEEAIAFYDSPAFANSPAGQVAPINLTAQDIDNIGRFLRVLNASFNAQIATQRLDAALELVNHFQDKNLAVQQRTLQLAGVELQDAINDLQGAPGSVINPTQLTAFISAMSNINTAITSTAVPRQLNISQARNKVFPAAQQLGTGTNFILGQGNNMF